MGRSDNMLIIRGVNIFPSQIQEVLFSMVQGAPLYQMMIDRKGAMDVLEVRIEVTEEIFSLEMQRQRAFLEMLRKRLRSVIGIDVTVKLVEPKSLPGQDGKIAPVIDSRPI
jgi:phenylacetate-CoA ligase